MKEENLDNIDKMLFDYFDNEPEEKLPTSTRNVINKSIKKIQFREFSKKLNRVAIIIISLGILTTGIVFASDIIAFVKSLFINSTEAIDKAVENGYVQNIDMDFVYDQDIGIKVDNLVMDDINLDISFLYEYKGENNIS